MLGTRFPQQSWYGQRVLAHSLLWQEGAAGTPATELVALADDRVRQLVVPAPPMYFVVVCGAERAALPRLPSLSMFDDGAQSLYRDYQRALLAEKRLYWDEIDARRIAEARLADVTAAVNALTNSRNRVTALEADLQRMQQLRSVLADTQARLAFRESWRGWLRWPLSLVKRQLWERRL